MIPEKQPNDRRSWISLYRTNRVTMVLAALGVLAAVATTTIVLKKVGLIEFDLLRFLTDSDEAPIRVRNGSLDLIIASSSQTWTQSGTSGNWKVNGGERYKDEFDLTVAIRPGGTCGGQSATGAEIIFTYSDDKKIRLSSVGRHTWVKPDGVSMTWDSGSPQKLSYTPAGFLKAIEIGTNSGSTTPMCSFTAANQLDHVIVLNLP